MNNFAKKLLGISFICGILIFTGCSNNNEKKSVENYKYAIINSSQSSNGKLTAYDKDGKKLFKETVKAKGIDENGSSHLSGPLYYNDKHYIGAVSSEVKQDKLLTIDNSTLEINELSNLDYTGFLVYNDYIYTSFSEPVKGTTLKKVNLTSGECVKEVILEDLVLPLLIPLNNELILIGSKETNNFQDTKIVHLSMDTLAVKHEESINNLRSPKSYDILDNKIYFIPTVQANTSSSNQLIIYNVNNQKYEILDTPLKEIGFIKIIKDKLYAIQRNDIETNSNMFIMNLNENNDFKIIELDHTVREAKFLKDELTIASDNKIYVYNIENMELKNSFEFENDDLLFGTLIVKE